MASALPASASTRVSFAVARPFRRGVSRRLAWRGAIGEQRDHYLGDTPVLSVVAHGMPARRGEAVEQAEEGPHQHVRIELAQLARAHPRAHELAHRAEE